MDTMNSHESIERTFEHKETDCTSIEEAKKDDGMGSVFIS